MIVPAFSSSSSKLESELQSSFCSLYLIKVGLESLNVKISTNICVMSNENSSKVISKSHLSSSLSKRIITPDNSNDTVVKLSTMKITSKVKCVKIETLLILRSALFRI